MNPVRPYHAQQLARSLPSWTTHLHSSAVEAIMSAQRHPYLQADGQAEPWYLSAAAQQREALQAALKQRDHSLEALHKALQPLQGLTEFCQPLLQQALAIPAPVDRAVYFFQPFKRRPFVQVEGESGLAAGLEHEQFEYDPSGTARKVSLLEAALHNFVDSAETGPYSELHSSKTDSTRLVGLSVRGFVQTCRQLDLGQRYQDHLASLYDGEQAALLEARWCQASRDELRVHAQIAALQDKLDAPGLAAIEQLCAQAQPPSYGGEALVCQRLELFGVPLHEVLVIGAEQPGEAKSCVLYIPGAADGAVRQYASANAAAADLTRRMQHTALLQEMIRRAPQALQAGLSERLNQHLFDRPQPPTIPALLPKPNPRLNFATHPVPSDPWTRLYAAHVARLKADAACLAVPTAKVDRQARLALLEHIASVGLDLANVAAMFMPGLNTLMLAVGGAQLMNSVFHGIEAWEQDDKAQAAAQLESVLLNIGLMGATAGGLALIKDSRFVDSLLRIEHNGAERLWQPDFSRYASDVALPEGLQVNASGQYEYQGRHYVRLDGTLYEQQLDIDRRWRLCHPHDAQAYRPVMRALAEGAWRIDGEHPLDWTRIQLTRRLGAFAEALSDADLDAALQCTGFDEDMLRHAHIGESGTPPLLADALQRLLAEREAGRLIEAVRRGHALYAHQRHVLEALVALPQWPGDHLLEVFDGPEQWGSSVTYGRAPADAPLTLYLTRADLQAGQLSEKILAQLDDTVAARLVGTQDATMAPQALNTQLAEALGARRETLVEQLRRRTSAPLSQAAEVIQRQFSGLPEQAVRAIEAHASPAELSRLAAGRVPLRLAEEARAAQARVRLDRALLGLYEPRLGNPDSSALSAALQAAHPEANAEQILNWALADRHRSAALIGQQPIRPGYRSPLRMSDGRYGYPLSGRSRWRDWVQQRTGSSAQRRLQALYPALDNEQRATLLQQLSQRGDVAEQLRHLQREQVELGQQLHAWREAAPVAQRQSRELLRQALQRAARRDDGATLCLQHMQLEQLPPLSLSLPHITTLEILHLDLHELSPAFMQSFPHLQRLRLTHNPNLASASLFRALEHTPQLQALEVLNSPIGALYPAQRQSLASLTRLRELRVNAAQLALADEDWQVLTQLPVEHLQLRDNAITLTQQQAAWLSQMPRLLELDLSGNPLGTAPALDGLHHLRTLRLNGCNLDTWPDSLTRLMQRPDYALRNLQLSENAIVQLPLMEQLLSSAYARNLLTAHDQHWEFHFNRLDPQQAQALRTIGVGVVEEQQLLPDGQAADWRAHASDEQRRLWEDLFTHDDNRPLREVIERVGRSAQALDNHRSLGRQVWQVLQAAGEDETLRARLNEVASEFPPTCGDAGADGFSTLEIEVLAYRESMQATAQGPHLYHFYRRLFRRELVNQLAARLHAARLARQRAFLHWLAQAPEQRSAFPLLPALDELDDISLTALEQGGVDDVEIRLALRQALARLLDFPEPSQDMLYRETAQISQTTVDNVQQAVVEHESIAACNAWLTHQPSWQRFLERHFSARFAALNARWYQGMEYLSYCLDRESDAVTRLDGRVHEALAAVLPALVLDDAGNVQPLSLNSQQYEAAVGRLMSERQAELTGLYARLTAEQADPR